MFNFWYFILTQAAKASPDVNCERDNNLPLHLAAASGRLDLVKCLALRDPHAMRETGRQQTDELAKGKTVDEHDVTPTGTEDALSKRVEDKEEDQSDFWQERYRPRRYWQQQNRWGCTPHDLAFMEGHEHITTFLQQCISAVRGRIVLPMAGH